MGPLGPWGHNESDTTERLTHTGKPELGRTAHGQSPA